ncbi:MAG: hypothetical protein NW226_24985 [Microscillaceae bacterium]|nr:hypothetical protein [Microscillaceae bacterium]
MYIHFLKKAVPKSPAFLINMVLLLGVFPSCNMGGAQKQTENKLLAEVRDTKLYASDLVGLIPEGTSKTDSTQLVERYIHAWVKKQLLLLRAKSEVNMDETEIERKLQDYKYDLIAYQYEKEYIEKKLDTIVKDNEIQEYLRSNRESFLLKEPLVKSILVALPLKITEKTEIANLIKNNNRKDLPKLKEYCIKFADTYHLNDSNWVELDNLILNTPFDKFENKDNLLIPNNFTEFSDQDFVYYFKTLDVKKTGEEAPLEFITQTIKSMVINQRKVKLSQDLKQNIYEEAQKNNLFIIHK